MMVNIMQRKMALCWVALLVALLPLRGQAHASLVESTPAANSVVAEAPPTAQIRYTEPLDASYSRVELLNAAGERVSTTPSRVDPNDAYVMLLDLPPLPEGRYVIQWRALSTADGHTSQGTVSFGIGDPTAAQAPLVLPPPPPDPLTAPSSLDVTWRWLLFSALAIVVGSLIFGGFVWRPGAWSQPETEAAFGAASKRLEVGTALLALLATIGLLVTASLSAGTNPFTFAVSSRVGTILALRLALVGVLALALWRAPAHYRRILSLGVGAGALLLISVLSHSAVPQPADSMAEQLGRTAAAITLDWLHLIATAAWIGGLLPLLLALLILRRESPPARSNAATVLVARFTSIATAAVVTLALTGTIAAFQHIAAIDELWTTTYGRALSLKLILFGVLLLLGGYNRWRVHPQLVALTRAADGSQRWLRRLQRSIGVEIGASLVLLLAVGVLTAAAPAREAGRGPAYTEIARVGDARMTLQIVPGDIAGDVFALDVASLPQGVQPTAVLRGTMAAHHEGEEELQLEEVEPGRWGARGSLLAINGQWQVLAIVRAPGMNDLQHTFTVDTTAPDLSARATPRLPIWLVFLVGAGLAAALSPLPTSRRWRFRLQTSSLLFVIAGFLATTIPYYVTRATEVANPLTDSPDVLAAGSSIYQQNCVTCHGINGRGDGPAARSLPGLPADFTVPHFATHTDAEVFGWIKNGKPGTVMPAFGEQLSDEQIWQVVTHIRDIYKNAQASAAAR